MSVRDAQDGQDARSAARPRVLVVVATYNEIENAPPLVDLILEQSDELDVLVIDDNSPDGTGRWCDRQQARQPRVRCLHRPAKLGLGSAAIEGFRWGLEHGYPVVATMDADLSHPPQRLAELIRPVQDGQVDVMIGSRYVPGGRIVGWPWHRRLMSRGVNWYARWLLGLRVNDCSGAYRVYRADLLERLDLATFRSRGYSYLEEILFAAERQGARMAERPITFVDRQHGRSKIDWREALAALWIIFRLGLTRRWIGPRQPPAGPGTGRREPAGR